MTSLINIFLVVVAALFPIVNPMSNVPIFIRLTLDTLPAVRHIMAREIAVSSFVLLLGSMFLGSHILGFFGITLPALRIAGGAVIAIMGWRLLNQGDNPIEDQPHQDAGAVDHSFYPLTMPLTVGPGSIATAIALGSQKSIAFADFRHFLLQATAALAGMAAISLSVYLCYRFAEPLARMLGPTGNNVFMRLSAFLLLCIGLQIMLDGVAGLPRFSG